MKKLALLIPLLLFFSCSDDLGFTNFCEATLDDDFDYMADYIDDIIEDLPPFPIPGDPLGHEENLFFLIDELRQQNDCLDVYIECYACIETFPPQSEIRIDVSDGGFSNAIIVDIATPDFDVMFVEGFHSP